MRTRPFKQFATLTLAGCLSVAPSLPTLHGLSAIGMVACLALGDVSVCPRMGVSARSQNRFCADTSLRPHVDAIISFGSLAFEGQALAVPGLSNHFVTGPRLGEWRDVGVAALRETPELVQDIKRILSESPLEHVKVRLSHCLANAIRDEDRQWLGKVADWCGEVIRQMALVENNLSALAILLTPRRKISPLVGEVMHRIHPQVTSIEGDVLHSTILRMADIRPVIEGLTSNVPDPLFHSASKANSHYLKHFLLTSLVGTLADRMIYELQEICIVAGLAALSTPGRLDRVKASAQRYTTRRHIEHDLEPLGLEKGSWRETYTAQQRLPAPEFYFQCLTSHLKFLAITCHWYFDLAGIPNDRGIFICRYMNPDGFDSVGSLFEGLQRFCEKSADQAFQSLRSLEIDLRKAEKAKRPIIIRTNQDIEILLRDFISAHTEDRRRWLTQASQKFPLTTDEINSVVELETDLLNLENFNEMFPRSERQEYAEILEALFSAAPEGTKTRTLENSIENLTSKLPKPRRKRMTSMQSGILASPISVAPSALSGAMVKAPQTLHDAMMDVLDRLTDDQRGQMRDNLGLQEAEQFPRRNDYRFGRLTISWLQRLQLELTRLGIEGLPDDLIPALGNLVSRPVRKRVVDRVSAFKKKRSLFVPKEDLMSLVPRIRAAQKRYPNKILAKAFGFSERLLSQFEVLKMNRRLILRIQTVLDMIERPLDLHSGVIRKYDLRSSA